MEDSSSPPYRALASLLLYLFRKQAGPKEMAPLPPVYKAASLTTCFFPPKRQTLRSSGATADRFIESDGLGSVLKEKLRSVMEIHAKPPCENEKEREREMFSEVVNQNGFRTWNLSDGSKGPGPMLYDSYITASINKLNMTESILNVLDGYHTIS